MSTSLKPEFAFLTRHPILKTESQKIPEVMNHFFTQSFAEIIYLGETYMSYVSTTDLNNRRRQGKKS